MKKLNAYISASVGNSILMVLLVLLGLDFIAAIIDEMGLVSDQYPFTGVLRYALFSIPGNVFDLLPFAALVGALAGLGSLAANSELVVMRSAGVATARIAWMVVRPVLVILLSGMLISEFVAPHTETIAQGDRAIALRSDSSIVSRDGLWHREGNDFMHFNVVQASGVLYGVSIYSYDAQRQLRSTLYAQRAIFQADHWLLEDYSRSTLSALDVGSGVVAQQTGLSTSWDTALSPALLNILVLDPIDLSIKGLWDYSKYLDGQGLNSGRYKLAFWEKVLQPLATVSLVLIAVSFVFGPLREVTMGFRIFVGVLFGVVFRTGQDLLTPASLVYGFSPIYASLIPIVICLLIGSWFLRGKS
ncbi:MAG: lipopolysaccharide export system permease protein [Paraglaciecola psychrophila]|jgi:lipopolysaccharide export system permease protein